MRKIRRLTPLKIASLKTPGRHADGNGLELQISKTGTKSWLLRYTLHGCEHRMGLGSLDDFSLSEARERARAARQQLADGVDPLLAKRKVKVERMKTKTFRECADEFMAVKLKGFRNEKHKEQWVTTMEIAHRELGKVPVNEINTALVLRVLRPVWREAPVTAQRLCGRIERVIGFAIALEYRADQSNPARWRGLLENVLPARPKVEHFKAVDYKELPEVMQRLREWHGIGARALEFTILCAARSGEVLGAKWEEINFAERTWTIDGSRMKKGVTHIVPLSERAIEILKSLPRSSDFIFPGTTGKQASHDSMLMVLRSLAPGCTVHGTARSSFKDWARERTGFDDEVSEHALAHGIGDRTKASYRRYTDLNRRRTLMQMWADYCQAEHTSSSTVVPIRA